MDVHLVKKSGFLLCLIDQCGEFLEEVSGVVRAGCGFGVVLYAEDGEVAMAHAFDGAVVEIDVRDFDLRWERVGIDCKAVILRGDRNFSGAEIFHRLVATAVTELELESFTTESVTEDLIAQADAEDGHFP